MKGNLVQWTAVHFRRMVNSIAFYPAFIAFLFLGLSDVMISIDFSDTGKQIKAQMEWLKLKDASTARSIISVIAAGILSLTVFTFTMVMVILNQAASQMSNRVLDKMIGNRLQQVVLGFYIGTIVYSLFLLSAIRDIDSGIYVPALSTYLLIAFAIIDIFLFIYFLHYITQSVKYAIIINRIHSETQKAVKATCRLTTEPQPTEEESGMPVYTTKSGIYEGFNKENLMAIAEKNDCTISFNYTSGSYLLKNVPILQIHPSDKIDDSTIDDILFNLIISKEESIENNVYYGFRQLTEVAVKALSPGINDPGTAVESLRALVELLSFRMKRFPDTVIKDKSGNTRLVTKEPTFAEVFNHSLLPIWDYGKNDRFVQDELHHLLLQLSAQGDQPVLRKFHAEVLKKIKTRDDGEE